MEDSVWMQGAEMDRNVVGRAVEALARPSILLVEDDDDIRDLMITLLGMSGFQTTPVRTAEEALEQLRESLFDLVLTDYCLPPRTGGWLLQQASAERLLGGTATLVVTAHPHPVGTEGFEIMLKPFEADALLDRIRQLTATDGSPAPKKRATTPPSRRQGDQTGDPECPDPIELILYVSPQVASSATAIEDIKAALSRGNTPRVTLTVCVVAKDQDGGNSEQGTATAVVKRGSGPRTFILGHLTNPAPLLELLEDCEGS